MRVISRVVAFTALSLTAPAPVHAQAVPNLGGTWVLQVDKSDFGPLPGPLSRTDVIEHHEPKLVIKRTVASAAGETTSDLSYEVNGKPWKNMVGSNELVSTLRWDGSVLVMVSTVATGQGDATITDRYTLAADGKTLTQVRVWSVQGQEISQTMLLSKQP